MTPEKTSKIARLQLTRETMRCHMDTRYKQLEDALQETHRLRYSYLRIRRAYHFIDRELANIDGRFRVVEPAGPGKPKKSKEMKAVEDLSPEQLSELIVKLELLREREVL